MKLNDLYKWQIELQTGEVINQYDDDGTERSSKRDVKPEQVVRVSYIPSIPILSRHDIIIDKKSGEVFIRRFQRGFIQLNSGQPLKEYLHCCVTNRYRVYLFSNGNTLITHKDYELYL